MCSRWLCVVSVAVGVVGVQQVALCCVRWRVEGVNVQQVSLWWVWDRWGCECAAGGFVL